MKLVCLAIGKKHDYKIASAIDDYTQRLQHYTPLEWQIFQPAKGKISVDETKRLESAQLLAKLKSDDYVVLLDETGKELSSRQLTSVLGGRDRTSRRIVFVIGGAHGVADAVKQRANFVWSLSRLVFPHQMVRLILAEQLYRACTILRGEPYHHE